VNFHLIIDDDITYGHGYAFRDTDVAPPFVDGVGTGIGTRARDERPMTRRPARLTAADIRGVLRLANELHDLSADPLLRRRHMLTGLCGLLEADVGLATTRKAPVTPTPAGSSGNKGSVLSVGWDDADHQRRCEAHFRDDPEPDPMIAPVARQSARQGGALVTLARHDAFDDAQWAAHPQAKLHRERFGIDERIASMYPVARNRSAWIFLYRNAHNRKPFGRRHTDILHVIHAEMDWTYRPTHPAHEPPEIRLLTVRQKQTLHRLLAGDSEKQVAAELGLSRHTVHVHVKSLYKVFKVNTRNELLARFVRPPTR
jgi:DNA-binding CsgD family transcriptional regulator